MSNFSSSAILIRRIDHGDFDLILTFLTLERGKVSCIAKYAKKSVKRFSGVLELFYDLDIVCTRGRGKLPFLKEASVRHPHMGIRCDILKTAYAGYWAQLVDQWMEEGQKDAGMFGIFQKALSFLDQDILSPAVASIFFQMKFLIISGIYPDFVQCNQCGLSFDKIKGDKLSFDLGKGGLTCKTCTVKTGQSITLSRGAVKQLIWITEKPAEKIFRIRFSAQVKQESLSFLETFIPFHLGIRPKSLAFLQQIREKRPLETNICIQNK
jgi:DNA repair protein RecO (recombination protein O)